MTRKQWVNGDVLTAADQNALSDQAINRFADATARDASITSPSEGMFVYLTGTNALQYYDGSSWTATDLTSDITGITTAANSSMAGGATSGAPSLTVDVNNTTSATAVATDYVLIADTSDSNATKRALISDITALAGDITGITTASNSSMAGGATTGAPSLTVDVNNTTSATAVATDYVLIEDVGSSNVTRKALISDITALAPAGTVTSVTGTAPIVSSGGATPAISVTTTDAQFILSGQVFSG